MNLDPFQETEAPISLHGLGFIQVKLGGKQRLHVWHPDLPRRTCFEHSQIHDHRFGFTSRVLVGRQINHVHGFELLHSSAVFDHATHIGYLHDGPRSEFGNRPWLKHLHLRLVAKISVEAVDAGQSYQMLPLVFHSTEPDGDGRVATLMTKTVETSNAAHSVCTAGVIPDADFDRFQMSEADMWAVVTDVLGDRS